MSTFIDYMYYRINKFYYKRDGRNGAASMYALALFFSFLLFDIVFIVLKFLGRKKEFVATIGGGNMGLIGGGLVVVFSIWIYFHYKDRYPKLRYKWKDEPMKSYTLKGWLVVFICSLPILIAFFL